MQTVHSQPSLSPAPAKEVFIHRHCMQQLIHAAIADEKNDCSGLLMGGENLVTNSLSVTDKLLPCMTSISESRPNELVMGVHLATNRHGQIDSDRMVKLSELAIQCGCHRPVYYLILYLDHKGRVDARLYADFELSIPVVLIMQENNIR